MCVFVALYYDSNVLSNKFLFKNMHLVAHLETDFSEFINSKIQNDVFFTIQLISSKYKHMRQ